MNILEQALEHAKDTGLLHVSIPVSVAEKIVKHIKAGIAETGEHLGNAIGESLFDR